jgi:uncharacterized protein (UPF0297 family)
MYEHDEAWIARAIDTLSKQREMRFNELVQEILRQYLEARGVTKESLDFCI